MGVVVDTSVFIDHERKREPIDSSRWRGHGDAFISAVTVSELLVGVYQAETSERRERRQRYVENVLQRFPALALHTEVARTHAQLMSAMISSGQMIGAHDLLIAATAVHHEHAVLTTNVADFRRVRDLTVLSLHEA